MNRLLIKLHPSITFSRNLQTTSVLAIYKARIRSYKEKYQNPKNSKQTKILPRFKIQGSLIKDVESRLEE